MTIIFAMEQESRRKVKLQMLARGALPSDQPFQVRPPLQEPMTTVANKIIVSRMYPGAKTLDERLREVQELEQTQPILEPNVLEKVETVANPWEVEEVPEVRDHGEEPTAVPKTDEESDDEVLNAMQSYESNEDTFLGAVEETTEEVFVQTKVLVENAASTGFARKKWHQALEKAVEIVMNILEVMIDFMETVSFKNGGQTLQEVVDEIQHPKQKLWIEWIDSLAK
jgi:hypothetical protein